MVLPHVQKVRKDVFGHALVLVENEENRWRQRAQRRSRGHGALDDMRFQVVRSAGAYHKRRLFCEREEMLPQEVALPVHVCARELRF